MCYSVKRITMASLIKEIVWCFITYEDSADHVYFPYHNQISRCSFNWQVNYLKKHYQVMSIEEVIQMIKEKKSLPDNVAIITFDDGFRNNYTVAYPILKKNNVPATIFLTTNYIDTENILWPDELYLSFRHTTEKKLELKDHGMGEYDLHTMSLRARAYEVIIKHLKSISAKEKDAILAIIEEKLGILDIKEEYKSNFTMLSWEEIREMHDSGLIDFGGHTANHEILSRLDGGTMKDEIADSCNSIKEKLNTTSVSFAYPNGKREDFSDLAKEVLKKENISCAVTTITGLNEPNQDLYELKRVGVCHNVTKSGFKLLVSGYIEWLKSLMKWK